MTFDSATGRLYIAASGGGPENKGEIDNVNVDGSGAGVLSTPGVVVSDPLGVDIEPDQHRGDHREGGKGQADGEAEGGEGQSRQDRQIQGEGPESGRSDFGQDEGLREVAEEGEEGLQGQVRSVGKVAPLKSKVAKLKVKVKPTAAAGNYKVTIQVKGSAGKAVKATVKVLG